MNFSKKHIIFSFLLGCMFFVSFSQINLSINLSATDAKCNGNANGSATVTATGGAAPYTYNWLPNGGTSNIASNLLAGTYKVLVTDNNGVSILDSITINQPPPLTVYIDSIIVSPCFKSVEGGGGACGCGNTLWAVVNGGTAPYRYHWTPNGQTTDSIFHVCYVLFTVKVTDTNNCVASNSLNVVIPAKDESAGITAYTNSSDVKIFPVPASNQLNISLIESTLQSRIEIYDMLGKKVLEQKVSDGAMLVTLDISSIATGNYLCRIVNAIEQRTIRFSKN